MADQEDDGDVDDYVRRAASERPPLSDEERSARVERQFTAARAARKLWDQVVNAIRGIE